MTVTEALKSRRAIRSFDPSVTISAEELAGILETANLAPSSMNLQPWEYLVLTSSGDKKRLRAVSYNQTKIEEASAVVVVLGNMRHFENAQLVGEGNRDRGYFGEEGVAKFVASARNGWEGKLQAQRDEAFRGGNLWAMAFMLAAEEAGWSTAPMGGYEADRLSTEFGIPEHILPVLIVCIGKPSPSSSLLERGLRISVADKLHTGDY